MDLRQLFEGKRILITGGCGTVGAEMVRQLLGAGVEVIRVFDLHETGQFQLREELGARSELRFLLGDVRDLGRLERAMEGIHVVFHTAALKHVLECEYNPFEAVQTNIVGTQHVITASLRMGAERVILTSSDKAASPYSVLGVSKLMAERLMTSANYHRGSRGTVFSSVRFGNVLGSSGSVVPVFAGQIQRGGPVRVTDGEMTRFVMSLREAVSLVFKAAGMAQEGEVFSLKMPAVRVQDLAAVMVEALAPRGGRTSVDIPIVTTGVRPGEKLHEELMTPEESTHALETEEMFIILPLVREFHHGEHSYAGAWKAAVRGYASSEQPPLSRPSLRALLEAEGLL